MADASHGNQVLNYNLFGEAGDLPDVVHCETIEARSRLHDWEFAPHRHALLHQVLLVENGGGIATVEGQRHDLAPMRVVNLPMGSVHGFTFERGTKGWVVTIASETMEAALENSAQLRSALARAAVFPATDELRGLVVQIFEEFGSRAFARAQLLQSLSGVLLGLTARALLAAGMVAAGRPPDRLITRFENQLERHFADHWLVSDYAAALGVTPTHLSRVLRAATGKPATSLIDDRIVQEARRNLVYTNLSVSTIAYALGFSDPAYFSRVFARVTGMSPSRFRALSGYGRPDTVAVAPLAPTRLAAGRRKRPS
jgi:AraC family transcriptional activator of pobA